MAGRIRERTSYTPRVGKYTYTYNGSVVTQNRQSGNALERRQKCADSVGNRNGDNLFDLTTDEWSFDPLDGVVTNGLLKFACESWTPSWVGSSPTHLTSSLPAAPTLNAATTKTLARSNPSRPDADIGVAIGELKELPGFIRDLGYTFNKGIAETVGGTYLSQKFFYEPLMNDVRTMLDFKVRVEKRRKALAQLRKHGLSRRVSVSSDTITGPVQTVNEMPGYGLGVSGTARTTTTRRVWGNARWFAEESQLPVTDQQKVMEARRVTYGIGAPDLATAWNLLPWSWMVDWFGSLGDVLEATRNHVGISSVRVCIMTHTETTKVYTMYGPLGGNGTAKSSRKQRALGTPFILPELSIPALSLNQTSIIGALAAAHFGRRR